MALLCPVLLLLLLTSLPLRVTLPILQQICLSTEPVGIQCSTASRDLPAELNEVFCPEGCLDQSGDVWGTEIYTDSSSICRAAIHAGKLSNDGGLVTVEKKLGQSSYQQSTRNGVTTQSYGPAAGAFVFDSDTVVIPLSIPGEAPPEAAVPVECKTPAKELRGSSTEVICPQGCQTQEWKVWGTDIYTESSSICRAAIHSGKLTNAGGRVRVEKKPGEKKYSKSEKNGITTLGYDSWPASFVLASPSEVGPHTMNMADIHIPSLLLTRIHLPDVHIPNFQVTSYVTVLAQCDTTAKELSGPAILVSCPEGCLTQDYKVWGTDLYTQGSSVCRAAIHAGIVTKSGGKVRVEKRPGNRSFQESTRNGVTSHAFGGYAACFILTAPHVVRQHSVPEIGISKPQLTGIQNSHIHVPAIHIPGIHIPEINMPGRHFQGFEVPGSKKHIEIPGSYVPGIHVPGIHIPEVNIPGTHVPGLVIPGIKIPGRHVPEINVPGINITGIHVPGAEIPAIHFPAVHIPGKNIPGFEVPSSKKSIEIPGSYVPGIHVPGIHVPEVNIPGTHVPGLVIPGIQIPDRHVPEINVPGINIPGMHMPGTEIPAFHIPAVHIPGSNFPGFEIPGSKQLVENPGSYVPGIHIHGIHIPGINISSTLEPIGETSASVHSNAHISNFVNAGIKSSTMPTRGGQKPEVDTHTNHIPGIESPGDHNPPTPILSGNAFSIKFPVLHISETIMPGNKNPVTAMHGTENHGDVYSPASATVIVRCNTPGKQLAGLVTQVLCPEECLSQEGEVWGNEVYRDESSICRAAIHAGKLTNAGGRVRVEKRPGQDGYHESKRNGIVTKSYSAWSGSFVIDAPAPMGYYINIPGYNIPGAHIPGVHIPGTDVPGLHLPATQFPDHNFAGQKNPDLHFFGMEMSTVQIADFDIVIVQCDTLGNQLPGSITQVFCPVECLTKDSKVWGDEIYKDDSSVCRAAIHAGKLTNDGGLVTVEKRAGQSSYSASARNGVAALAFGAWSFSFQLYTPPPAICKSATLLVNDPEAPASQTINNEVSIGCSTSSLELKENVTRVICPAGCVSEDAPVWGTNVYTDGSSVCRAAIHAGKISSIGGRVTVEKKSGPKDGFLGSTRNGVTSSKHSTDAGAFTLS